MRIDAHQHFWKLDRGDYGWLTPALEPLYRDFLPEHLAPHLEGAGISATILVQAAPTEAETRFLLGIARETPFVAGVVGWVDLTAPDAPDRLAALQEAGGGYLKGIRPMIQDIADPDWVLSPALDPAFAALVQLGLRFDALVRPPHLPRLLRRLERHPELSVVIDHGAKPNIAGRELTDWASALKSVASGSCAWVKLSGLVTEAGRQWREADLAPYVDTLIGAFGAQRTLWGSDWPVVNLAAEYGSWFGTAKRLLSGLSAGERERIFGGSAAEFYAVGSG
jgi:L-fuconolactonase